MTFFVFPPVTLALGLVGFPAGDIRYSAKRYKPIHELLAVIRLICVDNASTDGKGTQERRRVGYIRFISGRQQQAQRIAQAINDTMYFGGQSSP